MDLSCARTKGKELGVCNINLKLIEERRVLSSKTYLCCHFTDLCIELMAQPQFSTRGGVTEWRKMTVPRMYFLDGIQEDCSESYRGRNSAQI